MVYICNAQSQSHFIGLFFSTYPLRYIDIATIVYLLIMSKALHKTLERHIFISSIWTLVQSGRIVPWTANSLRTTIYILIYWNTWTGWSSIGTINFKFHYLKRKSRLANGNSVFRSRLHTIGVDIRATWARTLWASNRALLSINRLWNIRGVRPGRISLWMIHATSVARPFPACYTFVKAPTRSWSKDMLRIRDSVLNFFWNSFTISSFENVVFQ